MADLPTALKNSLDVSVVHDFYALEIVLPGATIRLLDGAGVVKFDAADGVGVRTFNGLDPIYGTLANAETLRDGFGDSAPAMNFGIAPATDGAIAALVNPANQFSPVRLWYGTRDPATGITIGVSLRFNGFLDYGMLEGDGRSIIISMQAVNNDELYFRNQEGVTLSNAFHKSLYPAEDGFAFVTGIQRTVIWGPGDRPSNLAYTTAPGGAGGGGGGRQQYNALV